MKIYAVKSKIHRVQVTGDTRILITYGIMTMEEAKEFKPALVFPNEENNLLN